MQPSTEELRERLRRVRWPGFDGDIVSAGFVKGIEILGATALVRFAPTTSARPAKGCPCCATAVA